MTLQKLCSLILVLGLLASPNSSSAEASLPAGFESIKGNYPAPETTFADQHSKPTNIGAFGGKILIINLWATWCAPCVKEMPALDRLVSRLPSSRFAVIAVSQDKGGMAVARPFLDRLGVRELPIYFDPAGRLMRDVGARGLPTTLVVSKSGTLVSRLEGFADWDSNEVLSYLISLSEP